MRSPIYQFFPAEEFTERLNALRGRMAERGVDVLLLNTPENIYYLSGYQTPGYYYYMALVVPQDGEPVLVPPPHEESMVRAFSWVDDYRLFHDTVDPIDGTADLLAEMGFGAGEIGVEKESWFLKSGQYERLLGALPDATFVDGSGLVEQGRMIKSPREIEYMRQAARAAETGMQAGLDAVHAGATERELGAAVAAAQVLAGSEYSGLPTFIASGERSMLVHATPSERTLAAGDTVFFEVPGVVRRYHVALTRTAFLGNPPDLLLRGSEVNRDALRLAKEKIRPGVPASEAFEAARRRIDDADVPYTQGRRVAYGIGTAFPPGWDEGHIFSINSNEHRPFQPGMAFHLITTMRLPGLGAIGCSDTVLVTDDGCETLTSGVPNEVHYR